MIASRGQLVRDAAARGKYAPLYRHLLSAHPDLEWRTTFGKVESILGFRLPDSARLHRPWFERPQGTARGTYGLTPKGGAAIEEYPDDVSGLQSVQ